MADDPLTTLFLPDRDHPEDTASEEERALVSRLRRLYIAARDGKRERYNLWQRNYRLVNNRQGGPSQTSTWAPAPRDSEIFPGLSSLVAWMTDQEVTIDLIPAYDPATPLYTYVSKITDDLNEVLYANWHAEDFETQIKLGIWDALQFSNAIFKAVWDNNLCKGYGNAVIRRVDPFSFYPDPNATSLYDAEYLIEAREMSFAEVERRFPDSAHRLRKLTGAGDALDKRPDLFNGRKRGGLDPNPGSLPSSGTYPGSNSAIGRWARPNDDRPYQADERTHIVYECWVRQNRDYDEEYDDLPEDDNTDERVMDSWRLVVFSENVVLLDCDAEDLYSHGQHPYEMFQFEDIGEFYGVALVDHLAYPQIYLNRLLTALQHNAELTGNPIWMEAANAGLSRVGIVNRPGQRLTLNSNAMAQGGGARWMEPPLMPPLVMELVQFWIQRIENTIGLTALQKGHTPTQRNAEGSLNMVQEAAFVRVRSAMANLQRCLEKLTAKLCDLIIDNYTDNRIMAVFGKDGELVSKFIAGNHFLVPGRDGEHVPLQYVVGIEVGANGPTSRTARINEADRLFAMGAVDDEYLLQKHRVRNAPDILERLYKKRQMGAMGGKPPQKSASRSPGK